MANDESRGVNVTWKYATVVLVLFCGGTLQLLANFVINDRNVQIRRIDAIENSAAKLETRVDYLATKSDIEALRSEITNWKRLDGVH